MSLAWAMISADIFACGCERDDLVVLAVQHQRRHGDRLQVLDESVSENALNGRACATPEDLGPTTLQALL